MNARMLLLTGVGMALVATVTAFAAEEKSKPLQVGMERPWLQQLNGEWDTEIEMQLVPGQPPTKQKGTETAEAIGDWVVSRTHGNMGGASFTGLMTLGFDAEKKKFVGTWIDSMSSYMWRYEGALDAAGKVLTLETEGPGLTGKKAKFKESIDVKSKDERVLTSLTQNDTGAWVVATTVHYKRKS